MKNPDYCKTVLYPFTLDIKKGKTGVIIAQCQQIPGIILQFDSMKELTAEFTRILDGWYKVERKIQKRNKRKGTSSIVKPSEPPTRTKR